MGGGYRNQRVTFFTYSYVCVSEALVFSTVIFDNTIT